MANHILTLRQEVRFFSVSLSEDEFYDAQEKIRQYSSIAKVVMLAVGCVAIAWAYWWSFHGESIAFTAIIMGLAFFVPGLIANILAMRLALHPYAKRLRDHTRNELSWKPKGWKRGLRDLGVSPATVVIVAAIFLVIIPLGLHDFYRRLNAFHHGTVVGALVTRSNAQNAKGTCRIEYRYAVDHRTFQGSTIGCEAMHAHPVGSTIKIRLVRSDPSYSVSDNEGLWTMNAAVPFLLIGCALLVALCTVSAARSYGPSQSMRDRLLPFKE